MCFQKGSIAFHAKPSLSLSFVSLNSLSILTVLLSIIGTMVPCVLSKCFYLCLLKFSESSCCNHTESALECQRCLSDVASRFHTRRRVILRLSSPKAFPESSTPFNKHDTQLSLPLFRISPRSSSSNTLRHSSGKNQNGVFLYWATLTSRLEFSNSHIVPSFGAEF